MNLLGLIGISLALGVLSWLGFLWSVRSGQYEDPEGPKYRMLDDDDEVPPGPPAPLRGAEGPRAAPSADSPKAPAKPPPPEAPDRT